MIRAVSPLELERFTAEILAQHPSPAALRWLANGWQTFLDGEPLERALKLNHTHAQGARQALRLLVRDRHLYRAAELVGGADAGEKARRLAPLVEAFEGHLWPAWRNRAAAPERASEINSTLFLARRESGLALPTSDRQLCRRILRQERAIQ